MRIKLNKNQFAYLSDNLLDKQKSLMQKLEVNKNEHFFIIHTDEDTAGIIRNWAGDELQKKGFDKNNELTADGEILEDFIDLFY